MLFMYTYIYINIFTYVKKISLFAVTHLSLELVCLCLLGGGGGCGGCGGCVMMVASDQLYFFSPILCACGGQSRYPKKKILKKTAASTTTTTKKNQNHLHAIKPPPSHFLLFIGNIFQWLCRYLLFFLSVVVGCLFVCLQIRLRLSIFGLIHSTFLWSCALCAHFHAQCYTIFCVLLLPLCCLPVNTFYTFYSYQPNVNSNATIFIYIYIVRCVCICIHSMYCCCCRYFFLFNSFQS